MKRNAPSNNNNNKTTSNKNSSWSKMPSFEDVLSADEDNLGNNQVTLKTISALLEPINKFIRTVQSDIKDLKKHSTIQTEQYSQLKAAVSKVLSNSVLTNDDWNKLKKGLQRSWSTNKLIKKENIKQIIQAELKLDPKNPENEEFFKVATRKAKDYIRCTLYRSFVRRVVPAVQNYFKNNPEIDPEQLDAYVNRIIEVGKWTKQNPTESDEELAKAIIRKTIQNKLEGNEDESLSEEEQDNSFPNKRRRLIQIEDSPSSESSDQEPNEMS